MSFLSKIIENFDELDKQSREYIRPQTVKEIFKISSNKALFFLELASRGGYLTPKYIAKCETCGRHLESYEEIQEAPEHIECVAGEDHDGFNKAHHKIDAEKVYYFND